MRLATSVILSPEAKTDAEKACAAIVDGYRQGLKIGPRPFILEEDHPQLRDLAVVKGKAARRFWEKLRHKRTPGEVPTKVQHLLLTCLPPTSRGVEFASRTAGVGSLGRPRYIALAEWEGGFVAREAKAAAPSAVHMREAEGRDQVMDHRRIRALAFQPRDPAFRLTREWILRRLSPESDKIELDRIAKLFKDEPEQASELRVLLLTAMGHAIANVHLGTTPLRRLLRSELKGLGDDSARAGRGGGGRARAARFQDAVGYEAASPQLIPSACM